MHRVLLVLSCLCGILLSMPVHASSLREAGDEAETLILRKLAEDRAYFQWILTEHEAGRDAGLDEDTRESEVKRSTLLVPLLGYMIDTAREVPQGERIDVPRVRALVPTTYTQLAIYLNLIGTLRSGDYLRARALSEQVDLEVGFGPTQSIEGYRISLTRHFYYLRTVALYHVHDDAEVVQWFGQIDADAEVKAMNLPRRQEVDSLRLADLSSRPIAVTAFAAQDSEDSENA